MATRPVLTNPAKPVETETAAIVGWDAKRSRVLIEAPVTVSPVPMGTPSSTGKSMNLLYSNFSGLDVGNGFELEGSVAVRWRLPKDKAEKASVSKVKAAPMTADEVIAAAAAIRARIAAEKAAKGE